MTKQEYGYAIKAAELLERCLSQIRATLEASNRRGCSRHDALYDMENALAQTERLLHAYFIQLVDIERGNINDQDSQGTDSIPLTLQESMRVLHSVLTTKRQQEAKRTVSHQKSSSHAARHRHRPPSVRLTQARKETKQQASSNIKHPVAAGAGFGADKFDAEERSQSGGQAAGDSSYGPANYFPSRSAVDTLLFRLIVTLELCLVRIGDAHLVIHGYRPGENTYSVATMNGIGACVAAVTSLGVVSACLRQRYRYSFRNLDLRSALLLSGRVGLMLVGGAVLKRKMAHLWMTAKVVKSTASLEEWQQQWLLVQTTDDAEEFSRGSSHWIDARSQRLIEHALSESPKSSFWHSEGEIRFLFLKRAMDLLYASIGTAVEVTKNEASEKSSERRASWKVSLAAAAAASYYSLAGPSRRASEAVESSSSLDVIRYAWGMVSVPAIKKLSLKASQLLKGAALAERVVLSGVPCFVLSRDSFPELAAAISRSKRREQRSMVKRLSTIYEKSDSSVNSLTSIDRQESGFPKKDVIFHLTGGGFFAHTIASDLPYLLDWSGRTGAVVICPEYALLPDYTFPAALKQVVAVYCSLLAGDVAPQIGFEVSRLVVTGESAGGNLAVSLCVKLIMDNLVDVDAILKEQQNQLKIQLGEDAVESSESVDEQSEAGETVREPDPATLYTRLPDAIMLSCPALNLSLELTPSRVRGHEDPVLPSGLISAISNAYLPRGLGVSKKDPLASPFYAPDEVLRLFPPMLLFASSDDPMLDDSVDFNKRLQNLGVESDLRAASNMPHAYWGLATAGFPEAKQVQHECEAWLAHHLRKDVY